MRKLRIGEKAGRFRAKINIAIEMAVRRNAKEDSSDLA